MELSLRESSTPYGPEKVTLVDISYTSASPINGTRTRCLRSTHEILYSHALFLTTIKPCATGTTPKSLFTLGITVLQPCDNSSSTSKPTPSRRAASSHPSSHSTPAGNHGQHLRQSIRPRHIVRRAATWFSNSSNSTHNHNHGRNNHLRRRNKPKTHRTTPHIPEEAQVQ